MPDLFAGRIEDLKSLFQKSGVSYRNPSRRSGDKKKYMSCVFAEEQAGVRGHSGVREVAGETGQGHNQAVHFAEAEEGRAEAPAEEVRRDGGGADGGVPEGAVRGIDQSV